MGGLFGGVLTKLTFPTSHTMISFVVNYILYFYFHLLSDLLSG